MTIKRSKLRESAHMKPCTLQIHPEGCSGIETTVLAHAPSIEKGTGFKSPDTWAAYACYKCHRIVDGQEHYPLIDAWEIRDAWWWGIQRTHRYMRKEGLLP